MPMLTYTKWYTPEDVNLVFHQLPLRDRCIFLCSIETGYRISSVLSIRANPEHIRNGFVEETFSKTGRLHRIYGQILQKHCSSAIDDDCWVLPFSDGIRHAKVSFTDIMASPEELRLIKAYIVDTLSHYSSPSTCAGKVRNLKFLFQFLHERHHSVKAISTPLIKCISNAEIFTNVLQICIKLAR